MRSNSAIASPASAIPSRSPIPPSSPAPSSRDSAGHPKQRHQTCRARRTAARRSRESVGNAGAAREDLGDEADFAFVGGGEDQIVGQAAAFVEEVDQRRGQRSMPRSSSWRSSTLLGRLSELERRQSAAPRLAASSRRSPAATAWTRCSALPRRQIVEGDQALAEAVAAAAAGEDQRHRGGGDRAIIVADQALQHARLAASAAGSGRGRDPLLVGAAQQQRHQPRLVEQAGGASALRSAPRRPRHWRPSGRSAARRESRRRRR